MNLVVTIIITPMNVYHVSEHPGIHEFVPRPAPAHYDQITRPVVFAITDTLLHNYLLPRECPRVTLYHTPSTSDEDYERFFGQSDARYKIFIEDAWKQVVQNTILYIYELPAESFELLDEGAGYYISYEVLRPLSVIEIKNCLNELAKRPVELQFVPNLWKIADAVAQSSLNFSIIRMRNALPRE